MSVQKTVKIIITNKYCDVLKSVYHLVIISNKYFHSWNSIRPPPMLNINKLENMKFKIVCAAVTKKLK